MAHAIYSLLLLTNPQRKVCLTLTSTAGVKQFLIMHSLWNCNICMTTGSSGILAIGCELSSAPPLRQLFKCFCIILFFYLQRIFLHFSPWFIHCSLYLFSAVISFCLLLISHSTDLNMETPNQSGHDMVIIFKNWLFSSSNPSTRTLLLSLPFPSFVLFFFPPPSPARILSTCSAGKTKQGYER